MFESKLQQKFDALWVLFHDHTTELRRFRGTDAIGIGHRGFRRPGSGRADGHHPVVPRWVQVRSDHEGQPDNEVAGSYVWQLTFAFAGALKTRKCDSNDWHVLGHSQLIILRCKIFQIWIEIFPGTSITGKARLESQSLFHKLSSVTCLSKSLCSWFQFPCLIIFSCGWSWGVLVSVKTFFMSLGLVTWCLGKSFKSGCGQGSRQGLP